MKMKLDGVRKRVITGKAIRGAAGLGLSLPLLLTGPAALAALDLGPAGTYAVFQMGTASGGTGSWTSSNVTMDGNVGFRDTNPGGNANTIVTGNVNGSLATFSRWTIQGTYIPLPAATLLDIANTARTFSTQAAAFTSLPNIGNVGNSTGSYTFTAANLAEPGTYIVNVGSLSLTGGNNFTLNGSGIPAGSRVIVNVASGFSLSGGSQVNLAGGLTPAQVLINYTGTSAAGASGGSAGTAIFGTFLGPNCTANFNAAATIIYGSLIVQSTNLSSGITIMGIQFVPEPATVMAGALLLLPLGVSTLRIVRKRRPQNLR